MSSEPPGPLTEALTDLADGLEGARLELEVSGVGAARAQRAELAGQIRDHLLPRLASLDAPLLAVVGGSTGSGKSTLVNTLAGATVSPAGVLRPTTRAPVLVCHPDDERWFADDRVLPGLPRVHGERPADGAVLHLRPVAALHPGVALLDAPDIDSVETANRDLATQLLAAADLWVFVTTAVRYADAVPWEFLGRAQERGTALAVVVNRIPPGATAEIVADLGRLLDAAGLGSVPVFPVEQVELVDGLLPPAAIGTIARLLTELADDAGQRATVVRRTLDGALASVAPRGRRVHDALAAQGAVAEELDRAVEAVYGRASADLAAALADGALLRGEVLERWQELIGTGELMRALQSRLAAARDRIGRFLTGRAAAVEEVAGEITSRLEQLVVDLADRAALDAVTAWRAHPSGLDLLDEADGLERASEHLRRAVAPEIREWQGAVLELVRARGQGKRTTARVLALGVNSVGIAVMIVLFSQTGGLTGGEVAVASGTATVSQALLTALFGEQAVRELTTEARRDLLARIDVLLAGDASRFTNRLDATSAGGTSPEDLAERLSRVERAVREAAR
jgi:hypothetical protein